LKREHPNGKYSAAIWRGLHASDPFAKELKMCRRDKEVEEGELAIVEIERSFCQQGRGKKKVKCPFLANDACPFQQQKQINANIWFAAHEIAAHEMPKVFGDVGWVIFDESPVDAFMFGLDPSKPVELPLDKLCTPIPCDRKKLAEQTAKRQAEYAEMFRKI